MLSIRWLLVLVFFSRWRRGNWVIIMVSVLMVISRVMLLIMLGRLLWVRYCMRVELKVV